MERAARPTKDYPTRSEGERRESIVREIDTFVRNPELVKLANISGLTFTDQMDTEARLLELRALAGANWEFRKGSERPTEDASDTLQEQQRTQALVVADKFKMRIEEKFQDRNPDAGIVLGSGGRHAFERTRHAIGDTQYIFAGDMEFGTEPISNTRKKEDEEELKRDERKEYYDQKLFGLAKDNEKIPEKEFMRAAIEANYGEKQPDGTFDLTNYDAHEETTHDTKGDKTYTTKITRYTYKGADQTNPNELVFMEIPNRQEDPRKRVSAEDCYTSLRQILPDSTKKVAISTTQVFAPFQHFDGLRLLPGVDNETTGFATTATSFDKPAKYLQEITSAINAAYTLHESMAQQA